MLDKIKQMLGIGEQVQTEAAEPITQDELLRQYAEQFQKLNEVEKERLKEEISSMLSGFERFGQQPETKYQSQSSIISDGKQNVEKTVSQSEPTLSEEPTVEEIIRYIEHKVTQSVLNVLEQKLQTQPTFPFSPAEYIVDSMVKQHPTLETVAEEAKQILSRLPQQFQNRETADFIMWWLKGKRSEAEKRETVAEMLGVVNKAPSHAVSTLPYTSEEINRYAEIMGIDPKSLRQRLSEELNRG